jgi:hypothetical protein
MCSSMLLVVITSPSAAVQIAFDHIYNIGQAVEAHCSCRSSRAQRGAPRHTSNWSSSRGRKSARSSNGGFWSGKGENALSFKGD